MAIFLCEGKVTKYVTMYVDAASAEEARTKVRDGDLENEVEGEVHDVDMDYGTVRKARPDEIPRKR